MKYSKFSSKIGAVAKYWRWWSGGGVISIAVALGCATAVDFNSKSDSTHGHHRTHRATEAIKSKRGVAAMPGEEAPHNGGKPRMPISASFDGEPSISISTDSTVQVLILAEADIRSIQGGIEGIDGLAGHVSESLGFTEIAAGETKFVDVRIPAKTGRIVIRVIGEVGQLGGETRMMSTSLELRVVNPKEARASEVRKTSEDMVDAPVVDSTGQVVRPMKSSAP